MFRSIGLEDWSRKDFSSLAAVDFGSCMFVPLFVCDILKSFAFIVAEHETVGALLLILVSFRFCILADFKEA